MASGRSGKTGSRGSGSSVTGTCSVFGEGSDGEDFDALAVFERVEADAGDAVEAVVPVETREPVIGIEDRFADAAEVDRAPERLGVGRLQVDGHSQGVGSYRNTGRLCGIVVVVGDVRPPGAELGGRRLDVDAGFAGAEPVLEGRHGCGIGGHGPEDGVEGSPVHVGEEGGFDDFLACGQDELEVGAIVDVDACGPLGRNERAKVGKIEVKGEAVEVHVGVAKIVAAVLEHPDPQAAPGFDADGLAEEVAAFEQLALGGESGRPSSMTCSG